jgi:hypothetical protein
VKLTTPLHLVPRSKNEWSYTSTPQYASMAWCSVKAQGQLYPLPYPVIKPLSVKELRFPMLLYRHFAATQLANIYLQIITRENVSDPREQRLYPSPIPHNPKQATNQISAATLYLSFLQIFAKFIIWIPPPPAFNGASIAATQRKFNVTSLCIRSHKV